MDGVRVLRITRERELLDNSPQLKRTLGVRDAYGTRSATGRSTCSRAFVHSTPKCHRSCGALLLTMNGIAAGLRNTG